MSQFALPVVLLVGDAGEVSSQLQVLSDGEQRHAGEHAHVAADITDQIGEL